MDQIVEQKRRDLFDHPAASNPNHLVQAFLRHTFM